MRVVGRRASVDCCKCDVGHISALLFLGDATLFPIPSRGGGAHTPLLSNDGKHATPFWSSPNTIFKTTFSSPWTSRMASECALGVALRETSASDDEGRHLTSRHSSSNPLLPSKCTVILTPSTGARHTLCSPAAAAMVVAPAANLTQRKRGFKKITTARRAAAAVHARPPCALASPAPSPKSASETCCFRRSVLPCTKCVDLSAQR